MERKWDQISLSVTCRTIADPPRRRSVGDRHAWKEGSREQPQRHLPSFIPVFFFLFSFIFKFKRKPHVVSRLCVYFVCVQDEQDMNCELPN